MPNKKYKFPIGGIELPTKKSLTNGKKIETMTDPDTVAIPLSQHIGAPAEAIVKKGDQVKKGDCIGEYGKGLSAKIHSSINGEVKGIESRTKPGGGQYQCIVIEKNVSEEKSNSKKLDKNNIDPETIRQRVKDAGVVGLGGAGFPTHVKLNPPEEKNIDTVIINGAECEPFLTVDHRLMLEEYEYIFRGLELIKTAVNAPKGIVAIEANKPDAIKKLQEKAKDIEGIEVRALDTRYPHGAEKHLIKAILDREIPQGELPMEVGVVVNNVQTSIKIAQAVDEGESLNDRVLTVSGSALTNPKNLRVPIGTAIKDVIEYCGGPKNNDYQVVLGGPMTGLNIDDKSIPVVKGTSGIVLLSAEEYAQSETRACINCGKCGEVCPVYLSPNRITAFVNNELVDRAVDIGLNDCIECGACAYVCPAKRPLLRWIKRGKAQVNN
ncbi:MAG: electron transport complex subunit RsxC [Bacillota bacterium]